MIEVTLDQLAHELGMDPLEIRRKNFIPKEDFPAAVATGVVYDSGDYHGTLDKLLEHVDVDGFRRRAGASCARGHLPGDRLLHVDRDLRPGALAGHRPGGRRGAGRPVGVGDGPRSQHRRGHRLHRHLAPRPGPRHRVRADRRRQARRRPLGGRGRPRRHRDRARRDATPTGRARWPRAARRSRGPPRRWSTKAKAIVAAELEAAPGGHRGRRRQVLSQGLAGQGDGAGRRRRHRLHRRGPRGHGAGTGGDDVLRPGELRVPVRRSRLHRRRGRRDRQGEGDPLRRRRRLRPGRSTRC